MTGFAQYIKCSVEDCIHEAQFIGKYCRWHFDQMQSRNNGVKKKISVEEEQDIMGLLTDTANKVQVRTIEKELKK